MGKHATLRANSTTVDLNGLERILLLSLLPQEGSLLSMRVLQELRTTLALTQDEIAALGKGPDDPVRYDELERVPVKSIRIGPVDQELIVTALQHCDKSGKVRLEHLPLYERFGVEPLEAG